MTRRIFIYEDTCGGGCEDRLPALLRREGMAMLRALAGDFASLENVEVVTTLDKRIDPGGLPLEPLAIGSPAELASTFDVLAAECDLSLIVAPELGGRLTSLSRRSSVLAGSCTAETSTWSRPPPTSFSSTGTSMKREFPRCPAEKSSPDGAPGLPSSRSPASAPAPSK